MSGLKVGQRVRAKRGSVSEIWSEGGLGTIAELRDPKGYSGNDSNNLIRWDSSQILMGFRQDEVYPV